jgi:tRNA 2-selenouridine synthase
VQVLDLEGLAGHRVSLLGEMPGGQPAQKAFEYQLAAKLHHFDPARPVIVEAESSKIGGINLPPSLWEGMKAALWFEIQAPVDERARYLDQAYDDVLSDGARLKDRLSPLRLHRGHALVDQWEAMIDAGERRALCQSLVEDHYDPAYDKSMRAITPNVAARFETAHLDDAALETVADQIAERVQTTVI